MVSTIQALLPYGVVISHVLLVIIFLAVLFRRSWGGDIVNFVGRNAIVIGFLVALSAVAGSLFYSNGVGFEPCYLCWWQRVAIYPVLVLFAVGLRKRDRGVFAYITPLSIAALLIASYHSYVQWGGNPLIPCDATASCTKLYVDIFGYITIPTMSLTIVLYLLLLAWINKVYTKNENSNA